MVNTEGGTDDEEFRVAAVVDRVNTTMAVWMGTTIGCCQCHNHKYDPFTQKEYYRLFAFFNNTADRGRSTAPRFRCRLPRKRTQRGQARTKLAAKAIVLLGAATWRAPRPACKPVSEQIIVDAEIDGRNQAGDDAGHAGAAASRARRSSKFAATIKNPGDKVTPGVPAKLHPLVVGGRRDGNRLDLARWLVSPENPLVGRVTMNRIWARYLRQGHRRNQRGLRHPGRTADASGIARLPGRRSWSSASGA